jgi:hypothetical protein
LTKHLGCQGAGLLLGAVEQRSGVLHLHTAILAKF